MCAQLRDHSVAVWWIVKLLVGIFSFHMGIEVVQGVRTLRTHARDNSDFSLAIVGTYPPNQLIIIISFLLYISRENDDSSTNSSNNNNHSKNETFEQ